MTEHPYRFPRSHRLHGSRQFQAVFASRVRRTLGPLSVVALPNNLPHNRLGLSVGRRVGNSVQRHHVKRLVREAFRLGQHDRPTGYDVVVIVRPHPPAALTDYRLWLDDAIRFIDQQWRQRGIEG